MQAAGLIKEKTDHKIGWHGEGRNRIKPHRTMAKPVLVATITKENSNKATLIEETKDGMGFITSQITLPNGKNAWKNTTKADKTKGWGARNKVGTEESEESSDDDTASQTTQAANKSSGPKTPDGSVFNILLYVGFILFTLGLILTLVGMGDRGFKSEELKLIGPTLIVCGVVFAVLRILFCNCPRGCRKGPQQDERALLSPSTDTLDAAAAGGTTNPAFQSDTEGERRQLPPIKTVQQRHELIPTDAYGKPLSSESTSHEVPHYMEDEVEEDLDLGLKVDYGDAGRSSSGSTHVRPASGATASVLSQESKTGMPDVSTDSGSEIILNPAKLRKT